MQPSRRADANQAAHEQAKIEAAGMNEHALANVGVAPQVHATHPAGFIEMREGTFQAFDHWIAFFLLLVLGLRMLREAMASEADAATSTASHVAALATAAFATSVDAAAAGLTLPLLGIQVPLACITIGVTTALLCAAGYALGSRVPDRVGKHAEFVGGLVLIGLGTKILIEHLTA